MTMLVPIEPKMCYYGNGCCANLCEDTGVCPGPPRENVISMSLVDHICGEFLALRYRWFSGFMYGPYIANIDHPQANDFHNWAARSRETIGL